MLVWQQRDGARSAAGVPGSTCKGRLAASGAVAGWGKLAMSGIALL